MLITKLFGIGGFSDFIIRKLAHFTEFAGLGLLFAIALKVQTGKAKHRRRLYAHQYMPQQMKFIKSSCPAEPAVCLIGE